jgi:RNA polymerase sigma-70 factor (ECF subfamily)
MGAGSQGGEITSLLSLAVQRAKAGDRAAIVFLYVRHADDVFSYLRGTVRDTQEAEELTQRVFADLEGAIGGYRERNMPFFAWLLRFAREVLVEHVRGRRAICSEQLSSSELGLRPLHGSLAGQWIDDVRQALTRLPRDEREVLVLRHFGGLSPTEIAALTGESESSVCGLHRRGREALRKQLVGHGVISVAIGP